MIQEAPCKIEINEKNDEIGELFGAENPQNPRNLTMSMKMNEG